MNNLAVAVIPCSNCQDTIGQVISETKRHVDNVIVVDDGSSDDSAEISKKSGATLIKLEKNLGVGFALRAGFSYSISCGYSTVITLDADNAHNPENIPHLLDVHFSKGNLLTVGNRWGSNQNKYTPSSKVAANLFATELVNSVSFLGLPDVACGFRILEKPLISHFENSSDRFGFLYDMLLVASKLGRVGFADVEVRYDAEELLITKQTELLDFLEFINRWAMNQYTIQSINNLRSMVLNWTRFGVELKNGDVVFACPVQEYSGYIFQQQNPVFYNGKAIRFYP